MIGLPSDPEARGRLSRDEYEIGRVEGEILEIDDTLEREHYRFGRPAPAHLVERRRILAGYLETLLGE